MKTMTAADFKAKYVKKGEILPNEIDVIKGNLVLDNMGLDSLYGIKKVEGDLNVSNNKFYVLDYIPEITGMFSFDGCKDFFAFVPCEVKIGDLGCTQTPFWDKVWRLYFRIKPEDNARNFKKYMQILTIDYIT